MGGGIDVDEEVDIGLGRRSLLCCLRKLSVSLVKPASLWYRSHDFRSLITKNDLASSQV